MGARADKVRFIGENRGGSVHPGDIGVVMGFGDERDGYLDVFWPTRSVRRVEQLGSDVERIRPGENGETFRTTALATGSHEVRTHNGNLPNTLVGTVHQQGGQAKGRTWRAFNLFGQSLGAVKTKRHAINLVIDWWREAP
jgi:hypothetical protein